MRPSHKFGFRSSAAKGRHEGLVPRNDVLTMVSHDFLLHGALPGYFLYLVSAPPEKPTRRCKPEEGYLRCSKRFDYRSHSIFFHCSSLSQLDDVGAGKLREMLTLHTNRHAVHGRFTPKDDCERQVWNSGAASWTQRENYHAGAKPPLKSVTRVARWVMGKNQHGATIRKKPTFSGN